MSDSVHAEVLSPTAGVLEYTLESTERDGIGSFTLSVRQVANDGTETRETAEDFSCDVSRANEIFRAVVNGEVEPCIFHDVVYDLMP